MAEGWQTYAQLAPQLHLRISASSRRSCTRHRATRLLRSALFSTHTDDADSADMPGVSCLTASVSDVLPGEDVSSARALARGREYIVALLVHGMMVDLKDDEAEETKRKGKHEQATGKK